MIRISLYDQSTGGKAFIKEYDDRMVQYEDVLAEVCSLQMNHVYQVREIAAFKDVELRVRYEKPSQDSVIIRTRGLDVCHIIEFN